ncbi:MAG: hypothetical protein L3K14_05625 [Thermoplasmata archaeon]|nr:hypothetical protein [Thermoplasmata archaeon]
MAGVSTRWTEFDLIDGTFHHSPIDYTVSILNATVGTKAVFNASESPWRLVTPSGNQTFGGWTPSTGVTIALTDLLQIASGVSLSTSGYGLTIAMGTSGGIQEQQLLL